MKVKLLEGKTERKIAEYLITQSSFLSLLLTYRHTNAPTHTLTQSLLLTQQYLFSFTVTHICVCAYSGFNHIFLSCIHSQSVSLSLSLSLSLSHSHTHTQSQIHPHTHTHFRTFVLICTFISTHVGQKSSTAAAADVT